MSQYANDFIIHKSVKTICIIMDIVIHRKVKNTKFLTHWPFKHFNDTNLLNIWLKSEFCDW